MKHWHLILIAAGVVLASAVLDNVGSGYGLSSLADMLVKPKTS